MRSLSIFIILASSLLLASANNAGIDVYETVFDFCDGKETEEGLTLAEVMENKDCLSHLTTGFGMLEEDIPRHFQTIDENGDGLVSKQEVTCGLNRNFFEDLSEPTTSRELYNPWTMKELKGFDSTQEKSIIKIANKDKKKYDVKSLMGIWYLPTDTYDSFRDDVEDSLEQEFGEKFDCFVEKKGRCYYDNIDCAFFNVENDNVILACKQEQPGTWCPLTCELNTNSYETVEIIIPQ